MSGFIYLWLDRKHRRFYIGSHWGPVDDGYICSSRWMRKAYRRRPSDFKRRIVKVITTHRKDLLIEEHRWLKMIKRSELKVRYYNLKITGDNLWHASPDNLLTVAEKISKALKGRQPAHGHSKSVRAAMSKGRKATYAKRRKEFGSSLNERTKQALDRTGTRETAEHKSRIGIGVRAARAANPRWDRVHKKMCACCGRKFKGRETQKHCSVKCRANHWYRTKKSPNASVYTRQ